MNDVVTPLTAAEVRPAFTDEAREKLKETLAALDKARQPILKAREPLDEALRAIDEMHDQAEADAGVEIIDNCVGCERLLVVGDLGHTCADGPIWCEACAPTWNDLAKEYEDPEIAQAAAESDGDTLSHETIKANVAAGHGDKKHVWRL